MEFEKIIRQDVVKSMDNVLGKMKKDKGNAEEEKDYVKAAHLSLEIIMLEKQIQAFKDDENV